MRLNLLNQTVIVGAAVAAAGLTSLNPRFGTAVQVNDRAFKYSTTGDNANAVMIERVDLSDLFGNIPQDISEFTFESPTQLVGDVLANLDIDLATQEFPVDMMRYDELGPDDALGQLFMNWKRVVGLNDLKRSEVDLSSFDDHMLIDARNAVLFKGTIPVKIK